MNTDILKAQGLCKSYGNKQVLHNLDLELLPGKIYGLIGRNGAAPQPAGFPIRPLWDDRIRDIVA